MLIIKIRGLYDKWYEDTRIYQFSRTYPFLSFEGRYTKYSQHGLRFFTGKYLKDTINDAATLFTTDETDRLRVRVFLANQAPNSDWGLVIQTKDGQTLWELPAYCFGQKISEDEFIFEVSEKPPFDGPFANPLGAGTYKLCLNLDLNNPSNKPVAEKFFNVNSRLPLYRDWSQDPHYAKVLVCFSPNQNEKSFIHVPVKIEKKSETKEEVLLQIKQVWFKINKNPAFTTDEIEETSPVSFLLPKGGENSWNEIYINLRDLDAFNTCCNSQGIPLTVKLWRYDQHNRLTFDEVFLQDLLSNISWCDPAVWGYTSPTDLSPPKFEISISTMPKPSIKYPASKSASTASLKCVKFKLIKSSDSSGETFLYFKYKPKGYITTLKFLTVDAFYL